MADRTISLESDGGGSAATGRFGRSPPHGRTGANSLRFESAAARSLLLLVFLALLFVSLLIVSNVAINFHISTYGRREGVAAIMVLTALIAGAFLMDCPYPDQLGVILANWLRLGTMNASLFATEGVLPSARVSHRFPLSFADW